MLDSRMESNHRQDLKLIVGAYGAELNIVAAPIKYLNKTGIHTIPINALCFGNYTAISMDCLMLNDLSKVSYDTRILVLKGPLLSIETDQDSKLCLDNIHTLVVPEFEGHGSIPSSVLPSIQIYIIGDLDSISRLGLGNQSVVLVQKLKAHQKMPTAMPAARMRTLGIDIEWLRDHYIDIAQFSRIRCTQLVIRFGSNRELDLTNLMATIHFLCVLTKASVLAFGSDTDIALSLGNVKFAKPITMIAFNVGLKIDSICGLSELRLVNSTLNLSPDRVPCPIICEC